MKEENIENKTLCKLNQHELRYHYKNLDINIKDIMQ